ncbi:unnamed protein product, partial [Choristocarpus tenellus]
MLEIVSQIPEVPKGDGMEAAPKSLTSKERRALRRASLRDSNANGEHSIADPATSIKSDSLKEEVKDSNAGDKVCGGTPGAMNAKERRAARRAAARTGQETSGKDLNSNGRQNADIVGKISSMGKETSTSPAANVTDVSNIEYLPGSTAKERRLARYKASKAAAAAAVATPAFEADSLGSNGSMAEVVTPGLAHLATLTTVGTLPIGDLNVGKGSTTKERRLARRAAERASSAGNNNALEEAKINAEAPTTEKITGSTVKERRLARRAEQRKRDREGGGEDGEAGGVGPVKKQKRLPPSVSLGPGVRGGNVPHIVFVGQLAFNTTAKAVEEHFRTKGFVEGKISVRLLTKPGTNPPQSKGMAFVEVRDATAAYKCLSLHHSRLDGRLLNVERTSGGGKGRKTQRIEEKRVEQKEYIKGLVDRVLREAIDAGRLSEAELDADAIGVLEKMEGKVVERAVKDYCDKPDRLDLWNPSAWFTHHAHQLAFRDDPDKLEEGGEAWLKAEQEAREGSKKGRGGRGRGSGGRGGGGGR